MPSRVVVVDDNPGFRRIAVLLLKARGYDVVGEAADAASAFAVVVDQRPDAVLIDYHLPDVNGELLCRRLAALVNAPRMLLTSSEKDVPRDPDLAFAFVTKDQLASVELRNYL